jgi:hypothetical protein
LFDELKPQLSKFEAMARNYSTLEQKEPYPLIPFTANKNVFVIKTPHITLNTECAERYA